MRVLNSYYKVTYYTRSSHIAIFCFEDESHINQFFSLFKSFELDAVKLVAHLKIFRLFMKGKFDAFLKWSSYKKSSKWNSRPVYCSQLYGNSNLAIKCRNYTNFAFSLPFECLQMLKVYIYVHQIQNWRNAIWVKKEFFSLHIAIQ